MSAQPANFGVSGPNAVPDKFLCEYCGKNQSTKQITKTFKIAENIYGGTRTTTWQHVYPTPSTISLCEDCGKRFRLYNFLCLISSGVILVVALIFALVEYFNKGDFPWMGFLGLVLMWQISGGTIFAVIGGWQMNRFFQKAGKWPGGFAAQPFEMPITLIMPAIGFIYRLFIGHDSLDFWKIENCEKNKPNGYLDDLISYVVYSDRPPVRERAAEALKRINDPRVVEHLNKLCCHENANLRDAARAALQLVQG